MYKEEFKKIVEQLSLEDLIKLKDFAECLRDSEQDGEAYPVFSEAGLLKHKET